MRAGPRNENNDFIKRRDTRFPLPPPRGDNKKTAAICKPGRGLPQAQPWYSLIAASAD